MADFQDVVKQLKDNKISQDVGFNRLENAFSGGDPKSLVEEKVKQEQSAQKKEQGFFASIAAGIGTSNSLLKDGFGGLMDSKGGFLGGVLQLLGAPLILLGAFFKELTVQINTLYTLFGKGLVKVFKPIKNLLSLFRSTFVGRVISQDLRLVGKALDKLDELFKAMRLQFRLDIIDPAKSGITKGIKSITSFFERLRNNFKLLQTQFKGPLEKVDKVIQALKGFFGKGITAVSRFFQSIGDVIGKITKPIMDVFGFIQKSKFGTAFSTVFNSLQGAFRAIGTVLGKLFLPITIIMGGIESVTGFIAGFKKDQGGFVSNILGGLEGGFTGLFNFLISAPLDLIKSLISWVAGKLGFKNAEKTLDEFSFAKLFTQVINSLFNGLRSAVDFIGELFSFPEGGGILAGIGKLVDILFVPLNLAINFIKGLFGFDKDKEGKKLPPFSVGKFIVEIIENAIKSIGEWFSSLKLPSIGELATKGLAAFKNMFGFGGSNSSMDAAQGQAEDAKKSLKTANLSGIKKYDADEEAVIRDELDTSLSRLDSMRNKRGTRQYQNELKRVNLLKTELNQLSLLKKEQQNQAIKNSALNKGSSGNVTNIIDASTSAPTQNNNNTNSSTFSALGNLDPITRAAIASAT